MKAFGSLLATIMMSVVLSGPAQAGEVTDPITCVLDHVTDTSAFIKCVDNATGDTLPIEEVPLPTITLPPVTLTLPPLPAVTELVTIPGPVRTLVVPGKTITAAPGETVFLPGGTETVVVQGPVETRDGRTIYVTATITPSPQLPTPTNDGKVVQGEGPVRTVTKKVAVGLGLVAIVLIAFLLLMGMWLGYVLGYKESDKEQRKFLEALRDQFFTPGKHKF